VHSSFQAVVLDRIRLLKVGVVPALTQTIQPCTTLREKNLQILDAACISKIEAAK
jgi:hypothetical protein